MWYIDEQPDRPAWFARHGGRGAETTTIRGGTDDETETRRARRRGRRSAHRRFRPDGGRAAREARHPDPPPRCARRPGARESQQEADGAAVQPDGNLVRRPERWLLPLHVRAPLSRVHRPGQERLRGRPADAQAGQAVSRRDRPVLPGRPADDHDAGLADRHGAAADGDLHGLELQRQLQADLPRRTRLLRSEDGHLHLQRRVASATGKATRWS